MSRPTTSGICRVCGCSNDDACDLGGEPCAWADPERTLCTGCVGEHQGTIAGCDVYSPGTFGPNGLEPLSPIWRAVLDDARSPIWLPGQAVEAEASELYLPFGSGSK